MSRIKFVPDLFLEVAELNRLDQSLRDNGFAFDKINETANWGIVKNKVLDPDFNYFKIIPSAINGNFRIQRGFGQDSNRNTIFYDNANIDIPIPQMGTDYWVKINYGTTNAEQGLVSIGGVNQGLLQGIGTTFTQILRGQPNFPSTIKFLNSINYPLNYEVLNITDDNNAVIQGVFNVPETNLQYAVVGTFTNGVQPPLSNEFPFVYDSCQITLVPSNGSFPTLIDGQEFIIGLVSYTVSGTVLQDYRFTCAYESLDKDFVDSVSEDDDKHSGLEFIKKFTTNFRDVYVVSFDWKLRITSEVQNNANGENSILITSGIGGAIKNTSQFVDGDYDGWRYYYTDGNYSNILSSIKQGANAIKLIVDSVRIGSGDGLCISPNAESIEIQADFVDGSNNVVFTKNAYFGIAQANPTILISQDEVLLTNQIVNLSYTLKNNFKKTQTKVFNQSTYYTTLAFDNSGQLINANAKVTDNALQIGNTLNAVNPYALKRVIEHYYPLSIAEVNANFDNTGLAFPTSEYAGRAICNGNNNTPQLLGYSLRFINDILQVPVGTGLDAIVTPDSPYKPLIHFGDKIGEMSHANITQENAPHVHLVDDPGHIHNITGFGNKKGAAGGDPIIYFLDQGDDTPNPGIIQTFSGKISNEKTGIVQTLASGVGQPHNNLDPSLGCIPIMKIV